MKTKIIPVIHYADDAQAMRNAEVAFEAGSDGVMVIHMEGTNHLLPPVAMAIKARWPDRLVGLNLLGVDPVIAVATSIAAGLDMTWTDDQLTHSARAPWNEAWRTSEAVTVGDGHTLFTGVAFKHQAHEPDPEVAAMKACQFGFVPTTSGSATGVAAEAGRVARLRDAIGGAAPLAIASGVTPENVHEYAPHLTHILVATGVSSSFHEFDPDRLRDLRVACDECGRP